MRIWSGNFSLIIL